MPDDVTPRLQQQLVMTPQLQLAIKLLSTPSPKLATLIAGAMSDRPGVLEPLPLGARDPTDALEITRAADDDREPWFFLEDSPFAVASHLPVLPIGLFDAPVPPPAEPDGDVWIFGDPPQVRANGRATPRYRVVAGATPDHAREAQWLLFALRQRSRTFERIVASLVARHPAIAETLDGTDIPLTPIGTLAEAIGMHESTITRATAVCTFRTRHGTFSLESIKRGIGVRRH